MVRLLTNRFDRILVFMKGGEKDMANINARTKRKSRRGFAAMDPQKQRDIASKGGRAAHQKGTAHEWTSEEARRAGKVGGQATPAI